MIMAKEKIQIPRRDAFRINGLEFDESCNPVDGVIKWDATRSIFNAAIIVLAVVLAPLYFSWSALLAFFCLCFFTLCCGHSVGFHRRLIHRSFKCPKWLEYIMVYLGTAVGMGGPLWTIRTHDMRDWAQRTPHCHDYFAHRAGFWRDAWWYLHCRMELKNPPKFNPGPEILDNRFYRFLQRSAMFQQIPIGVALYVLGGMPFLVWGVFVRVAACTTMHWYISRIAHTKGPQTWTVDGAGMMGHNLSLWSIPTMGESWHNNHHAFPASARHGNGEDQIDIGFNFVRLLGRVGLAWDIQTPDNLPQRRGLRRIEDDAVKSGNVDRPAIRVKLEADTASTMQQ
jgi:sn-1 stearoyl-lipid 9-desaturase